MQSIIEDQYTAAQAYFLCVIGLLFFESFIRLPPYLLSLRKRDQPLVKGSRNHWTVYTYFHKLSTQPSFIPFITNHRLPDLLRLAVFIFLNILWGWNSNEFSTDYKLYGWLTIANGGLGFLLAARSNLFSLIARIPSSTLLMYHRWIGLATVVHATIHFALNTRHDIVTDQLATAFSNRRIQVGIMAWISLCLIAVTSISFIRRRFFEVFYYSHFLFIVFAVGALIHASKGPEFLLPGILLWVIDRGIRFVYNFRKLSVKSVTPYVGGMTKFKINGVTSGHPGQIAWVQLQDVSFLNWHPFTIASAPGEDVVLAIRGLGGYTKKLQHLAPNTMDSPAVSTSKEPSVSSISTNTVKMRMDGPYGVGSIRWGRHPVTVLVAGGIGITPGISIATHIINQAAKPSVTEENTMGAKFHIHLLWVVKERSHIQWFEEELTGLAELAKGLMPRVTFDVTIHVTGSQEVGEDGIEMENRIEYLGPGVIVHGRPNVEAWFGDLKTKSRGMDVVVNACGPRSLIATIRKAAAKASWNDGLFYVEEEVFEL